MKGEVSGNRAMVTLMVFALVFVLLAIFYKEIFSFGTEQFSEKECQISLLLTEKVDISAACVEVMPAKVPLRCSRNFVEVTDTSVEKNGKNVVRLYDPSCPDGSNSCLAAHTLAKEMESCWRTFFEGDKAVFQQVEQDIFDYFDSNQENSAEARTCFICSEVTLQTSAGISDFKNYLENKERTFTNSDDGQTFYDYFANSRTALCNPEMTRQADSCWEAMALDPELDQKIIEMDSVYAVTFIRQGMGKCQDGDADPEDLPSMSVQAVPADNIGQYCDVVIT